MESVSPLTPKFWELKKKDAAKERGEEEGPLAITDTSHLSPTEVANANYHDAQPNAAPGVRPSGAVLLLLHQTTREGCFFFSRRDATSAKIRANR
jgi:hypothetical protein